MSQQAMPAGLIRTLVVWLQCRIWGLSHRRLARANLVWGTIVGLPWLAPILVKVEAVGLARATYFVLAFLSQRGIPICAQHFQETWPQLRIEFVETGRVRCAFKDLPVPSIHPQATNAHEATQYAGEQGAYWAMHDRLFVGQAEWAGRSDHVATFKGYAAELGLQRADFDACLDSGR